MKRCLLIACCLLSLPGMLFAATERRVALVIGNNDYQNLPKLEKAVNDANAVAAELKRVGFEVVAYNNIGQKKMNQAINEFAQGVSGGGVGVFFYAGHGVQLDNQNYLIPVDMDSPKDPADVADQAISIPRLQDKLADARAKYTLLVLDACRNNPLPKKAGRSIGATRGLAMTSSPSGQTVLYSAGANQEALDALDERDRNPNGLFTREFLPMISKPGISAVEAIRQTRSIVKQKARSVNHDQDPAYYDQSDGDFYFVSPPAQVAMAPSGGSHGGVQSVDPKAVELSFWDSIKDSRHADDFKEYLAKYPNGQFAGLAGRRITALSQNPGQIPSMTRSGDASVSPPATAAPTIASKIEEQGKLMYLQVTDLRATKRDNLLRIQAEITNTGSRNQQLYYRFKWLDQDGFSVWDEEAWKPVIVYGAQKQTISAVSPTFKASDFRLILQSPSNWGQ